VGGSEVGAGPQARTLFLVALLLSAFQTTLPLTQWFSLVFPPASIGGSLLLQILALSLPSFLINPVLLFYVFYRLGKKVPLAERYISVGISLFVGGMLGYVVPYFLDPVAFGSSWGFAFPDLLSLTATILDLTLLFVRAGLDTLFPGFVAIAIANIRSKSNWPPERVPESSVSPQP